MDFRRLRKYQKTGMLKTFDGSMREYWIRFFKRFNILLNKRWGL